jgi:hypothetical protein
MKKTRRTKAQMIRYLLDLPGVVTDERHILSLEVCIDRLNEKLPLTRMGNILCGYYSNEIIAERNRKTGAAKAAKYANREVRVDMRGKAPRSAETRAKIAAAQRERHRLRKEGLA